MTESVKHDRATARSAKLHGPIPGVPRRGADLSRNVTSFARQAHTSAVISSPELGVLAVAAQVFWVLFAAWWARYLNSVSAADPAQIPLSLLFLELSGYYVNAVQLHVHAADVLVRCGIHREGFR